MAHIRVADLKSVLTPPVDLRRGRSPKYVVEEHVAETAFSEWSQIEQEKKTYEAALNVGDSTGGARKACGNSLVLQVARQHLK